MKNDDDRFVNHSIITYLRTVIYTLADKFANSLGRSTQAISDYWSKSGRKRDSEHWRWLIV